MVHCGGGQLDRRKRNIWLPTDHRKKHDLEIPRFYTLFTQSDHMTEVVTSKDGQH